MSQPHLLGIPPEIRDAILELCLVVEGPINPYPAQYESKDPFAETNRQPDVALLEVDKVMNQEATEILYSKNTWRLNLHYVGDASDTPMMFSLTNGRIWAVHQKYIRHIFTSFDMRDFTSDTALDFARSAHRIRLDGMTQQERREEIHTNMTEELLSDYAWKYKLILNLPTLSVIFDLKNLYCPMGCCRADLLGRLCHNIFHRLASHGQPPIRKEVSHFFTNSETKYTIIGLERRAERDLVLNCWAREPESKQDHVKASSAETELITWF
jgi:hypothetical protein